jgi:hypothetical protein
MHVDEPAQAFAHPPAEAPETGDPRVDAVLVPLAALQSSPVSEHAGVYDDVHRGLQDALADLDRN